MTEGPLEKPAHLRAVPTTRGYLALRPAGLAALALGVLAFIVVAITQNQIGTTPDWRISVPGFVLTAVAALASLARREGAQMLWLVGLGAAAASLVFGWFVLLAIVLGVTLLVMLIVHTVM